MELSCFEMIAKCIILATLTSSVTCQYAFDAAMKPDVIFDNHNDRFDLTSLVAEQNRQFDNHNIDEYESRRHPSRKKPRIDNIKKINNVRRYDFADTNFASHDEMNSYEGGSVNDFETNLEGFQARDNRRKRESFVDYLHGENSMVVPKRRSNGPDPEKDILMHYAVPIDIKINGYLQVPLVE